MIEPWHERPYAVIDFETDGVDPLTCMPVSVAVVRFSLGAIVSAFSSPLNPGRPIPAEATAVHGISDADVANAPTVAAVASEIFEHARGALPVAYNAPFDRAILHRFVTGSDCPMFDQSQEWLDPLVYVRGFDRFVSGAGRHKLEATCKRWSVPMDAAHNALSDAKATGRLLWAMRERLGSMSAARLIEATVKRRAEQDAEFQAYKARVAR
jgi:DNA polymerase-3 subunit epsilon